ncbi:MAG: hypothetical protein QOI87_448, partial [Bradyrhizobium sp.]|nr:hypothetical protein [Bradyrhizobium sp.]
AETSKDVAIGPSAGKLCDTPTQFQRHVV